MQKLNIAGTHSCISKQEMIEHLLLASKSNTTDYYYLSSIVEMRQPITYETKSTNDTDFQRKFGDILESMWSNFLIFNN